MKRVPFAFCEADVLTGPAYAAVRAERLRRISAFKKPRRVCIGSLATVLFESRETVLAHVEEVLHLETRGAPAQVRRALEEHADLVPRGLELTATLLIDGGPPEACRSIVADLRRRETVLYLRLGSRLVPAETIEATANRDPDGPVHDLRFAVDDHAAATLRAPEGDAGLLLRCDGHAVFAALPPALRQILAAELSVRAGPRLALDHRSNPDRGRRDALRPFS